jgi:hypothetical protein
LLYFFSGLPLSSVNTEQGLGITIDNELKFSKHAKKSGGGARSTMEHTVSTCSLKSSVFCIRDLCALSLKLECLASTDFKKDKVLENVQRHTNKVMSSMQELSYPARLAKLKLLTLVYRRKRGDAIF